MDLPLSRAYIGRVEQDAMFAEWFDRAVALIASVPKSSLLMLALAAMLASWIGGTMLRRGVPMGGLVRSLSTVALVGVLVTVVLQVARIDPRFDVAVAELGMPDQIVEGGETRIPLADDGHYWLRAKINGTEAAFLVDTGATLTAISAETAERAGIAPRRDRLPMQMSTANGTVTVPMATIEDLRFGNVAARGLDAVIASNIGDTNVIGMNLLSRLASVRIEQRELILVPNNPQPTVDWDTPQE